MFSHWATHTGDGTAGNKTVFVRANKTEQSCPKLHLIIELQNKNHEKCINLRGTIKVQGGGMIQREHHM